MSLTPKNWKSFQHYTDRKPAWIKLHRGLLDDYAFCCLPVASRALAPLLWLLASEYEEGQITASDEEVAFRLRLSVDELRKAIQPLIDAGFFFHDSATLAACKQLAIPEKERQVETQVQKEEDGARTGVRRQRKRAVPLTEDFQPDWSAATREGLSRLEAERELSRFRNHAAQTGRTCIDWQAAWRNWCSKAAQMLGRPPPGSGSSQQFDPSKLSPDDWLPVLKVYEMTSSWNPRNGPAPGQPGCHVPESLIGEWLPERQMDAAE